MTQPDSPRLTRPAIGILVDPERMAAARKSAMLERIELAALSQTLDLRKIAAEEHLDAGLGDIDLGQIQLDMVMLRKILADAGVNLKKPGLRIGVSRDEIAKLETGGRKRPKITTLDKLISALNYARAARGKPLLDVEDLQVPGEVLTKTRPLVREVPDPEAPIMDLGLSVRVRKKLYGANISTAGQLAACNSSELLAIPGLGVKGLDEIVAKIAGSAGTMFAREAAETEAVAEQEEAAYQETGGEIAQWERDLLDEQARQLALDAYQEASNEIYYASGERDQETG